MKIKKVFLIISIVALIDIFIAFTHQKKISRLYSVQQIIFGHPVVCLYPIQLYSCTATLDNQSFHHNLVVVSFVLAYSAPAVCR